MVWYALLVLLLCRGWPVSKTMLNTVRQLCSSSVSTSWYHPACAMTFVTQSYFTNSLILFANTWSLISVWGFGWWSLSLISFTWCVLIISPNFLGINFKDFYLAKAYLQWRHRKQGIQNLCLFLNQLVKTLHIWFTWQMFSYSFTWSFGTKNICNLTM